MFFFLKDTAPTEIYPLSLHDALPIYPPADLEVGEPRGLTGEALGERRRTAHGLAEQDPRHGQGLLHERGRSEEHTSELQSRQYLVCRLLLEKKKTIFRRYCYIQTHRV